MLAHIPILIGQYSLHGSTLLLVLGCSGFYALRVVEFGNTVKKLMEMRNFFTEVLEIPEVRQYSIVGKRNSD